ncbi:hypothetical protein [Planotetraspora kaengkrachanensis]|nr:hypothetical protein [Planotetraspora kaengkrachanensis]
MSPSVERTVDAITNASSWNARVNLVRQIPERFGRADWRKVFAKLAKDLYVPNLTPDFAYVDLREDFELPVIQAAYDAAMELTEGFANVSSADLERCLAIKPETLRIFRLLLGYIPKELAAATKVVAATLQADAGERYKSNQLPMSTDHLDIAAEPVSESRIKSMEQGRESSKAVIPRVLAETISRGITKTLFPEAAAGLRTKQDRPDLVHGWNSVRQYSTEGVPYPVFLHQRHYGGSFLQVLNSGSTQRGDRIEDAVQELFERHGIPFVRTGNTNQAEIASRFNLTVQPAPDFVVHDANGTLRGMLECKTTNDGGTARDKAARFRGLRVEANRLGGIPVFAVLGGLGWTRTADALGPVVQECDGRVFTLATLDEMVTVDPMPHLFGLA